MHDDTSDIAAAAALIGILMLAGIVGNVIAIKKAPGSAFIEKGVASVYGDNDDEAWGPTASGEVMNPGKMNAAHKTLPFGTRVKVENRGNHRSIIVRINDRGPFRPGRIIDLTPVAAAQLGCDGLCSVTVEAL